MLLRTRAGIVVLCLLAFAPRPSIGDVIAAQATATEDIRLLPLLDQHGEPTTLRAFEGRTLVLNFIFTHCLVACHTQVRSLNALRAALPPDIRSRVQFLSVSIDPSRDTPDKPREYARNMGIDDPDWRFATASPDHIARIARAFGVKRESLSDGQMDHTLMVILFDAKGRLMQRYAGAEVNAERLVREIGDVARSFGPASPSASPGDRER